MSNGIGKKLTTRREKKRGMVMNKLTGTNRNKGGRGEYGGTEEEKL
jgi:hypothetical protein